MPFLQAGYGEDLKQKIQAHIDASYKLKSNEIHGIVDSYKFACIGLEVVLQEYLVDSNGVLKSDLKSQAKLLSETLKTNILLLEKKAASPEEKIELQYTEKLIEEINSKIAAENVNIEQFNTKLRNKQFCCNSGAQAILEPIAPKAPRSNRGI